MEKIRGVCSFDKNKKTKVSERDKERLREELLKKCIRMIGEREVFKTDHLRRIGDRFEAREKCKNRK